MIEIKVKSNRILEQTEMIRTGISFYTFLIFFKCPDLLLPSASKVIRKIRSGNAPKQRIYTYNDNYQNDTEHKTMVCCEQFKEIN